MTLRALIVAMAALLGRGAPGGDVVEAIATVAGDDRQLASWMVTYASLESGYNVRAVNAYGRSFGIWQQGATCGKAAPLQQARCWAWLANEGKKRCPETPTVIVWGRCHGRDVLTGLDVATLAAKREALAASVLVRASSL